jgi:hypothetical protein
MFAKLRAIFLPFSEIAVQLKRLADLKELELKERVIQRDSIASPVILITEEPKKGDTTVSYGGEEDKPKSKLRQLMDGIVEPDEDDLDPLDEDTLA